MCIACGINKQKEFNDDLFTQEHCGACARSVRERTATAIRKRVRHIDRLKKATHQAKKVIATFKSSEEALIKATEEHAKVMSELKPIVKSFPLRGKDLDMSRVAGHVKSLKYQTKLLSQLRPTAEDS